MSVLLFLIPIALLVAVICGLAFLWSVKNNQFDDLDMQASKILFDNNIHSKKPTKYPDKNKDC